MDYTAGRGTTALGIIGTVLGGAGVAGNGLLGNLLGGNNGNCCSENMAVNRYELNLTNELASKDAKIGLLESNIYTDKKITETYATLNGQINDLAAEVRANKDAQNGINLQQAVYNGTNTAALGCLQNQVAQLFSLTSLRIPNDKICPGWGPATVTPGTGTTPTTAG
jgi:hypothetical protein